MICRNFVIMMRLALQNGEELEFTATSVQARMLGSPKFVENFS
jgi:hypothetical protein